MTKSKAPMTKMKTRSLRSDMHFWNLTNVSGNAFLSTMLSSPSLISHLHRYDFFLFFIFYFIFFFFSFFLFFFFSFSFSFFIISEPNIYINPRTHHGFSLLLLLSNVFHRQMSISCSNPLILLIMTWILKSFLMDAILTDRLSLLISWSWFCENGTPLIEVGSSVVLYEEISSSVRMVQPYRPFLKTKTKKTDLIYVAISQRDTNFYEFWNEPNTQAKVSLAIQDFWRTSILPKWTSSEDCKKSSTFSSWISPNQAGFPRYLRLSPHTRSFERSYPRF